LGIISNFFEGYGHGKASFLKKNLNKKFTGCWFRNTLQTRRNARKKAVCNEYNMLRCTIIWSKDNWI